MNKSTELKDKLKKRLQAQCNSKDFKFTISNVENAELHEGKIKSTSDTVSITIDLPSFVQYCNIECSISADNPSSTIVIYAQNEESSEYNEQNSVPICNANGESKKILHAFPNKAKSFRIDLRNSIGNFEIINFTITPYTLAHYRLLHKLETLKKIIHHTVRDTSLIKKFLRVIKTRGIKAALREIYIKLNKHRIVPASTYIFIPPEFTEDIKKEIQSFAHQPLISIVMPVYNAPPVLLEKAVNSIKSQWYSNWELCIADDASTKQETINYLKNLKENNIKITFLPKNLNISGATNAAFEKVSGDYTALMDNDDELTIDALYNIVKEINTSDAEFIYSDEDKLEQDNTFAEPHFKPDFQQDLFLSQNYINHLCVIKTQLIKKAGWWTVGLEGAQDYDLFLRVTELTDKIKHIPKILYHWRKVPGSTAAVFSDKQYAQKAGLQALQNAINRRNLKAEVSNGLTDGTYKVSYTLTNLPLISIIIPFKDKPDLLEKCLSSIITKSTYKNLEILCLNNNSEKKETKLRIAKLQELDDRITFYPYNKEFNYSAINNYAVSKLSKGEYIIFLNNDIEIITPSWIEEMLSLAQRDNTACVGGKLYFPNDYIQHAGIVLAPYTIHALILMYSMMERHGYGYFARAKCINNYLAVTAACMMVKKELFLKSQGFDEDKFPIAYNDVDFCLRMHEKGLVNVFTPFCEAYHNESSTRGYEKSLKEIERREKEKFNLKDKHRKLFENPDPCYNPNLNPCSVLSDIHPRWTAEYSKFKFKPFTHKILKQLPAIKRESDQFRKETDLNESRELLSLKEINKTRTSSKEKENLCIFSHYSSSGHIDDYVLFYLKSLSEFSDIIFVSTADNMCPEELEKVEDMTVTAILKENYGYDFGAWKTGFDIAESSLTNYKNLILCNDSVFGPLFNLKNMLNRLSKDKYDVFSVSDNYEIDHHLQSFFIIYTKKAFLHPIFQNFYKDFKIIEDKQSLIIENEIKFSRLLKNAGLKTGSYNKAKEFNSFQNIMHQYWKELITDYKCPFIKRELLQSNPLGIDISNWKNIIKKTTDYNPDYISDYLKHNT